MDGATRHCAALALAAALVPAAASGQVAPPDPATVAVPDLSGSADPAVVENGWKYFFYHRPDTSFAEAHADIAFCYRFRGPANWSTVEVPRFVPWEEAGPTVVRYQSSYYGIVGDLMAGMVEGTLVRRDRQSKMRRCMEPRGYTRYGVAEEIWENVVGKPPAEAIAIQAKIASGPTFGGVVPEK